VSRVCVRRAQVFKNGKTVFFVASRGHHADIGGISPGSMPPFSHTLAEEGACIKSFKLVKDGVFQEEVCFSHFLFHY
jgi:5-oxoprolinase (ATP-hydrolysing)